jgi:hypothetical protein
MGHQKQPSEGKINVPFIILDDNRQMGRFNSIQRKMVQSVSSKYLDYEQRHQYMSTAHSRSRLEGNSSGYRGEGADSARGVRKFISTDLFS